MSETIDLVCPYPDCGQTFTDPRRYDYHINSCVKNPVRSNTVFTVNRNAPEKPKEPVAKAEEKPRTTSTASKKVTTLPNVSSQNDIIRLERTEKWTKYIVKDFNPMLYSAVSTYAGIPSEWADAVIFEGQGPDGKVIKLWDPSLRTRLTFTEGEAEKLAAAAARFSISPMGMAISAWIESNAGLIALAAAGFVAAKYGWRVMQTKAEVAQVKDMMQKQMEMMQAQAAMANAGDAANGAAQPAA